MIGKTGMTADSAFCFAATRQKSETRKGILLVTFGSGDPETQAVYQHIGKKIKAAFPDMPVCWAYTSHAVRKQPVKEGKSSDSVGMALARMRDEGFTHLAVQPLHIIAGYEFHDVQAHARAFGSFCGGFTQIFTGCPLLGTPDDLNRTVAAVMKIIPQARRKDEAAVLTGHGTRHPSHAAYLAMMYKFQTQDPNIYVGTLGGELSAEAVRDMLLKKGIRKAYLIPFMSFAGGHARNDMAGDKEHSWKSIFSKAGIACVPVLKGLAEYDDIIDIWSDHLKAAVACFEQSGI